DAWDGGEAPLTDACDTATVERVCVFPRRPGAGFVLGFHAEPSRRPCPVRLGAKPGSLRNLRMVLKERLCVRERALRGLRIRRAARSAGASRFVSAAPREPGIDEEGCSPVV